VVVAKTIENTGRKFASKSTNKPAGFGT